MKPWYPLLALAVTGAAITYHFVDQHRREAQLDQMHTDLVSLSTTVAEAQRRAADARPRPSPAPRVVLAAPQPEEIPPERAPSAEAPSKDTPGRRPVEPAEVHAQLDTAFAREGTDPKWTGQAQATAQTRLAAALPETSSLRSIECRESMCRFETVHEDADHVHQFIEGAFMHSATKVWNGGTFSTAVPEPGNDKVVIVSYLARDGEELKPMRPLQQ